MAKSGVETEVWIISWAQRSALAIVSVLTSLICGSTTGSTRTCPFETQFENVLELKSRGIVREIGVSNYNAAQLTRALEIGGGPDQGGLISVQNEFSPLYRHDLEVLEICEDNGIAFLPWSPLGGSKKVNRITTGEVGSFVSMAREKTVSPESLVLAWLLAYSPVIIPIPGATGLSPSETLCRQRGLLSRTGNAML
jgi:aryl-alcohol dehydrogenase-like predicted oxidoreductase